MPFSSLRPSFLLASTCCISVLLDVTPGVNTCLFYCEVDQTQCSRPYGTATCYLHTAILAWNVPIHIDTERSREPVVQEDANGDGPGNAHLGPPHQRWRRDALQPPEVPRDQPTRDTCAHSPTGGLRCVSWNTRGLLGSTASSQRSRVQKNNYLTRLARNNDIMCLQKNARER